MSDDLSFDIVIIGAGPTGLSAAIRLKQIDPALSVCVLEKGADVGAHILSGAVLEPRALNELIPNWKEKNAPLRVKAAKDKFLFLTPKKSFRLPTPGPMHNDGNYIISLGEFCRWLADEARALGVDIFTGFAASEAILENGRVIGVKTGDMGVAKDGTHTDQYQPGVRILAKQILLAEGCRGSLSKQIMQRFDLRKNCDPQTFGLGIKELWQIDAAQSKPGEIVHSIGWPLDNATYGGSFLYHLDNNQVAVGFIVGLDYQNPYLSPFEEFQRFKTHPSIAPIFKGGKRIAYGARALNEGGWQSIPKLSFPGGLLIGDAAGFLNVPKIKGTHTAMKSGMIAAECAALYLKNADAGAEIAGFDEALRRSWVGQELRQARNIRPSFRWGLWAGLIYAAIDTYILRGFAPWTMRHHADHAVLTPKNRAQKISYPKPDGVLTFDRLSSVFLSGTNHAENQPCHLQLQNPAIAVTVNHDLYDSPESRYCPAAVYEFSRAENKLLIHAQNCVHCKTCDIKDPAQNINWVPPQGGDGPHYPNM